MMAKNSRQINLPGHHGTPMPRMAGLDWLRLLAIALVTIQHVMSVTGHYDKTNVYLLSYGQTGVAIFCAISGYLAFSKSHETTRIWLKRRLLAIYPAYWLAMLFSFSLTWAFNAKPFTLWQFLSQMLGLGYFTHGWELINVVSWFISLILLCYLIAAFARWTRHPLFVSAITILATTIFLSMKLEVDLSRHILAFALGGTLHLLPPKQNRILFPSLLACLAGLWWQASHQFGYAAISGGLLWIFILMPVPQHSWVEHTAKYTYEYFLLHGIFLVGMVRLAPFNAIIGIILALLSSMLAAVLLKHLSLRLKKSFS